MSTSLPMILSDTVLHSAYSSVHAGNNTILITTANDTGSIVQSTLVENDQVIYSQHVLRKGQKV